MTHILMIDPMNPQPSNDISVYSYKSRFCHGLEFVEDLLYFMDDNCKVHILKMDHPRQTFNKIGERMMIESEA